MRHSYWNAILAGVVCTVFTAIGAVLSQIIAIGEIGQLAVMAAAVILSALIGAVTMKKTHCSMHEYGFNKGIDHNIRAVWFYIPLLLVEILPIILFGFQEATLQMALILALFTVGVGFNEEIYFRGLAFRSLSEKGMKQAVIGSSVIFGVLHAANAFGGKDLLNLATQISFAFLVGFVLAEIVSITKNLWIAILWHAAHDFIAMSAQSGPGERELLLGALQTTILLVYAVGLWKKAVNLGNTE